MSDSMQSEKVTIIGGTGDGGPQLTSGVIAQTPDHLPNIVIRVVRPFVAIGVRAVHFFLKTTLGLVTAGAFTSSGQQMLGATDAGSLFVNAAWWALVPTALGVGWDVVTILGNLEKEYPLLTGSI